jgi:hypothetical protein
MLHQHAQFEDGSVSVEAGLMEMLSRMETGRFKVFQDLNDWFEEFRLYDRKDGGVVKERDDFDERNAVRGHDVEARPQRRFHSITQPRHRLPAARDCVIAAARAR